MFKSKEREDTDITFDSDEEQIQFNPHQPRFLTPLCHVTTSSACDDLIIIQTPTNQDIRLKSLGDISVTKKKCSDTYWRDKLLITHPLVTPPALDLPMAV